MAYLSEAAIEQLVLDQLSGLGYSVVTDGEIGPDGKAPEREAYADQRIDGAEQQAVDQGLREVDEVQQVHGVGGGFS